MFTLLLPRFLFLTLLALAMEQRPVKTQLPHVHDLTWFTNSQHQLQEQVEEQEKRQFDASLDVGTDPEEQDLSNLAVNDKHTLLIMKEMTSACQQNQACFKLDPFDKLACIRRCVSPNCYAKIYDYSPLEPGEIDVLYPQYKACFHNLWKDKYRNSIIIDQ